jgi:hypothetical protein
MVPPFLTILPLIRLLNQNQTIAIGDLGAIANDLDGIPVRPDRGIYVDAAGFHRGPRLQGMRALFKVASLAESARPGAQAQRLVIALEEQLLFKLEGNFGRANFHPLAVEEQRCGVTIEDLLELLCCGRVRRAAEARTVVGTTKLALETHPRSGYNASGVDGPGFDGTQLTGLPDQMVKIDGVDHLGFTPSIRSKNSRFSRIDYQCSAL